VIEEGKFSKKVDEKFTAYYKPLIVCIEELCKVVFPKVKRWLREDRRLYVLPGEICTRGGKERFK
jgi:hypothetical protein